MKKLTYSTLIIVSVLVTFGIFSSNNQDIQQELNTTNSNSLAESKTQASYINVSNNVNSTSNNNTLEKNESTCDNSCIENIDRLRLQVELTDEKYEELLNRSDELVKYLKENTHLLTEFIALANNASSDHRNIIMAAFNQLELSARSALGEALIESSDWHSRFDGIAFLAQPNNINDELAQQFSNMLPDESNDYVRSRIIKALNQPDKFHGNQEIINTLEEIGYNDDSDTVRGEALIARVQLAPNPETVFNDAFSAIRSDQPEYQGYGLRALNKIVTKQALNESSISWEYKDEARYLFEELRSTKYDKMPVDFLNMVDDLYERFNE